MREQIRSAAQRLFLANGFGQTSMDAVSAAAGVTKQTLYRYYDTKAQLFADVLGRLIADPRPPSEKAEGGPDPTSQAELKRLLVRLSQRFLAWVLEPERLALVRLVIAEASRFPELGESFRRTVPVAGAALFMAPLQRAKTAGLIADWVEIRTAGRAFAGLLIVFILRDGLLALEPRLPSDDELEEMVQIFVDGVGSHGARSNA